ncbi:hypothetical protein SDC9_175270 [bioreactor metagenome]|uniref:Uncharacterized protein n=1 Tax=bioreactor metagenome TaxID=1076179 RepID=A0A645GNT0_9ZZZZ
MALAIIIITAPVPLTVSINIIGKCFTSNFLYTKNPTIKENNTAIPPASVGVNRPNLIPRIIAKGINNAHIDFTNSTKISPKDALFSLLGL